MPAQLLNAPLYQLIVAVLSASLLVSALLALPLKFTAESVFKFKVRAFDAFKAMFVSTFALTGVLFGLIWLRLLDLNAGGGIALQIVGLIVGLVILAFSVTIFVKAPDGHHPDFAQSSVVAAIMQVISLLIALAFTFAGMPMNGTG